MGVMEFHCTIRNMKDLHERMQRKMSKNQRERHNDNDEEDDKRENNLERPEH